jgi:hypothetical protein
MLGRQLLNQNSACHVDGPVYRLLKHVKSVPMLHLKTVESLGAGHSHQHLYKCTKSRLFHDTPLENALKNQHMILLKVKGFYPLSPNGPTHSLSCLYTCENVDNCERLLGFSVSFPHS